MENDELIDDEIAVPVIDAHVHFWQYKEHMKSWMTRDMKALRQDYLPGDLEGILRRNGVNGCIAVQAQQAEIETFYLVELANRFPIINGVVGWVDLCKEDAADRVAFFSANSIIKGWRHIVQDEKPGFLAAPAFRRGLSALAAFNHTYDILVYPPQLGEVINLVEAFPDQPFVLDHCGKPGIAAKDTAEWMAMIKELAQHPNVYCKLSGLFTEAKWKQWSPADFYPVLDKVFETFGTERLMFGSDWPVMLLSGIYVQWKSLLEKYMEHMHADERAKIFGGNAARFYNLFPTTIISNHNQQ